MGPRIGARFIMLLIVLGVAFAAAAAVPPSDAYATEGVVANPAELNIANRSIMVFRATLLGETPTSRQQRAKAVIEDALQGTDDLQVSTAPILNSYMVLLGGRRAFIVSPLDVDAPETSVQRARQAPDECAEEAKPEPLTSRS